MMAGIEIKDMKAFPRGFTERHLAILRLLAKGCDQYTIAQQTHLAVSTVRRYRFDLRQLIGAETSAHAVAIAYENGWLEEDTEEAA